MNIDPTLLMQGAVVLLDDVPIPLVVNAYPKLGLVVHYLLSTEGDMIKDVADLPVLRAQFGRVRVVPLSEWQATVH